MISNINNLLAEAAANPWKVYYYIAIFSTILFIFKLILFSFTGGGESEVMADFNTETDTDPSFGFFSFGFFKKLRQCSPAAAFYGF